MEPSGNPCKQRVLERTTGFEPATLTLAISTITFTGFVRFVPCCPVRVWVSCGVVLFAVFVLFPRLAVTFCDNRIGAENTTATLCDVPTDREVQPLPGSV
jgi:hypothetical protein